MSSIAQEKLAWTKFDFGEHLTDSELNLLITSLDRGIDFLDARGEHGGVLFKARLERQALIGFRDARNKP